MEKKQVTIYSTPTCHFCHMAKDYLNENNIEYTDHDVSTNLEARQEMMDRSGQMGVPQIVIGDELVVGFDKPRIDQLLGLGE
jgi:glutaredoxin-like YruB-family protein